MGCDSNAHHTIWGSKDISPRGKSLSEYLSSTNLNILNKGNTPTFVNRIRKAVIDITLATPEISRDIKRWKVEPEVTFSDHKWLTFKIESDIAKPMKFRNPRKTDWDLYRSILSDLISNYQSDITSIKEIDQTCTNISNAIIQAFESSCPLSNPPPRGKIPGWTEN